MARNPYFELYSQESEQELIGDLMDEAIKMAGFDVFYIPRIHVDLDPLFGEDNQSKFEAAYQMEAYVRNVEGFKNNRDFISMEGMFELKDKGWLEISRKSFAERVYGSNIERPMEGDLIYFPMGKHNNLFQISFVEDEMPFYQVGDLYTWVVEVILFQYSNEKIRTGVPEIDAIEDRYVSAVDITIGAGTGNYAAKEVVYQGANLGAATFEAEVISWATPVLRIKHRIGTLSNGVALKGNTSSASRTVTSSTIDDTEASTNEPFEGNKDFQELAEGIADIAWNPKNPFGGR